VPVIIAPVSAIAIGLIRNEVKNKLSGWTWFIRVTQLKLFAACSEVSHISNSCLKFRIPFRKT